MNREKSVVQQVLKQEFQDLLADHPNGVVLSKVVELYREKYGREPRLEVHLDTLGCRSVEGLLYSMKDAVGRSRPVRGGERLLWDRPRPSTTTTTRCPASTAYYKNGEGKDRFLAKGAVRVGHYCASLYERDWHRSVIVSIIDSDTVKVRYVDYGSVDRVPVHTLKPLLQRWGYLPAQAVRARLAGVRPRFAGCRWPHAVAEYLLLLVGESRFTAFVGARDDQEQALVVLLEHATPTEEEPVQSALLAAGCAERDPVGQDQCTECHLLAVFSALQVGAVRTASRWTHTRPPPPRAALPRLAALRGRHAAHAAALTAVPAVHLAADATTAPSAAAPVAPALFPGIGPLSDGVKYTIRSPDVRSVARDLSRRLAFFSKYLGIAPDTAQMY